MSRVIIFGIDGATWNNLGTFLDKLPNLSRIVNKGSSYRLLSTIPYVTPPAWTSFYTGVSNGKHGIIDFFLNKRDGSLAIFDYEYSLYPAFWDYLSGSGLKTILITPPIVNKAYRLNGILIPGFPVDDPEPYPKSIRRFLVRSGYRGFGELMVRKRAGDIGRVIEEIFRLLVAKIRLTRMILEEFSDWDLFFVVIQAIDVLQHFAMPRDDLIFVAYKLVDELLGDIMRTMESEDLLLVVSDHGFMRVSKVFYPNVWLTKEGLLSINRRDSLAPIRKIAQFLLFISAQTSGALVRPLRRLKHRVTKRSLSKEVGISASMLGTNSKAVAVGSSSNVAFFSILKPNYEPEELIELLKNQTTPDGSPLFEKVYTYLDLGWENIYETTNKAVFFPHIAAILREGIISYPPKIKGKIFGSPEINMVGDHQRPGILVYYGNSVKNHTNFADSIERIEGVAYQILRFLGFSPPNYIAKPLDNPLTLPMPSRDVPRRVLIQKRLKSKLLWRRTF